MCAVKGLYTNYIRRRSVSCTVMWRFEASGVAPDILGISNYFSAWMVGPPFFFPYLLVFENATAWRQYAITYRRE